MIALAICRAAAARNHGDDPAGRLYAAPLSMVAMARSRATPDDGRLVDAVSRHAGAERGAAANTLAAYRRDLDDFAAISPAGTRIAEADERRNARLSRRALAGAACRRLGRAELSAIRQLYRFLYAERHRRDDPAATWKARSGPAAAESAHDRRCRPAARDGARAGCAERRDRAASGCALRGLLPARTPLRDRLARVRAGRACRHRPRGAMQRILMVRGKGGRERHGAAQRGRATAMADYRALLEAPGRGLEWLFPSFGESGHLTRQHFARD